LVLAFPQLRGNIYVTFRMAEWERLPAPPRYERPDERVAGSLTYRGMYMGM